MQVNTKNASIASRLASKGPYDNSIKRFNKIDKTDESIGALIKFIERFSSSPMTLEQQAELKQAARCKTVQRGQFLLQEGNICRHYSFIVSGAVRMFSINQRGHVSILSFGIENSWVTDRESAVSGVPSNYNIEALECTEVVQLHVLQMEVLINHIPSIAAMVMHQEKQETIITQKRIHATLCMTAEERLHDLFKNYPAYPNRFSQTMLAAYLGIKPETLSRLKSRW